MSQISVVQYNSPHNHINVLQNTVTNKQSDRQIIVLRKPQQAYNPPGPKDDILIVNTARKKQKSDKDPKPNLQPVSVARRNARERNRVKQVNDGFATLRQHIPSFIAAAFENNSGRGGNKKLSKVETLRMAVEYIRSLEDILSTDSDCPEPSSESAYRSPGSSISPSSSHQNTTFSYQILSPEDDDDLSSTISPPPQQFIKIDASNTYHLLPNVHFENGENLDPMSVDDDILSDPSLLDHNIEFGSQEMSYLNNVHTTASLSPDGFQSESSMSPRSLDRSAQGYFIPVFDGPQERSSSEVKVEIETEVNEFPVISLKNEGEQLVEPKCDIVDVLHWWDQQQNTGS